MSDEDEQFYKLCEEFAENALANEPGKSPEMVDYIAEIVRTTVAFHMWKLLDNVEEQLKGCEMIDRTNAERQRRFRQKRLDENTRLERENAWLRVHLEFLKKEAEKAGIDWTKLPAFKDERAN